MLNSNRLFSWIFLLVCLIHFNHGENFTCDPNLSCGCSLASISITARIVGGETAVDNAWGWAIQLLKFRSMNCGAILISNSYAITAAHCTLGITKPSDLSIIAGTNYLHNLNGAGQTRTVIEYYVHPNFVSDQHHHDIAVLRFEPLAASSAVKFLCLPSAGVDPYTLNSNVVVAGWGALDESNRTPSPLLRQVTVRILASGSLPCQRAPITDASVQTCAGFPDGGKDACFGDSGSPLMSFSDGRWVLAGITAAGVGCARVGHAAVYTRMSAFVNFVNDVINGGIAGSGSQTTASSQSSGSATSSSNRFNPIRFQQIFIFLVILFIQLFNM